ncbi:MAG: peptidylprolyl isomerase, partial [Dehalococcoidia bacterium]
MTKQQQKRRRKRYEPGSAYAGDVRPTGVLGFMGSTRMIQLVFILMALALGAGGIVGVLQLRNNNSSNANSPDFVDQSDEKKPTATPPDAESQVQQFAAPPEMTIDPAKTYTATIKTNAGDIVVRLFADQAPETVNNFVFLANKGFYDDQLVDFADPQFSVETGNPY